MDGVINVYKEKGYTSHDVVAIIRGVFKCKAGHTGTLDPMAEGVLPVCLGRATKLAERIMNGDKAYRAQLVLGTQTDTEDSGGTVLRQRPVTATRAEIEACALSFVGEYAQQPPMYSAVKINGKRLYKLARDGVTVEREPRPVRIHSIELEFSADAVMMDVVCGKGTYIRTLCADIGRKLGCGAHMGELTRTRSGEFGIEHAIKLDELKALAEQGRADECITPIARILSCYRSMRVADGAQKLLRNGNSLRHGQLDGEPGLTEGERVLLLDADGEPAAVYRSEQNILKCEIML